MNKDSSTYLAIFNRGTGDHTRTLDLETFKKLVNGMAKPGESYTIYLCHFLPGKVESEKEFVCQATKS